MKDAVVSVDVIRIVWYVLASPKVYKKEGRGSHGCVVWFSVNNRFLYGCFVGASFEYIQANENQSSKLMFCVKV